MTLLKMDDKAMLNFNDSDFISRLRLAIEETATGDCECTDYTDGWALAALDLHANADKLPDFYNYQCIYLDSQAERGYRARLEILKLLMEKENDH